MFNRTLKTRLEGLAGQFPVVSVIGPRQSGKATLVQLTFPQHTYINLENPEERDFAIEDPKGFLSRAGKTSYQRSGHVVLPWWGAAGHLTKLL